MAKVTVNFDENLTYLMGNNGDGKTTLGLTGLWFVMQGIAEKTAKKEMNPLIGERFRFIGPDGKSAKGSIILQDSKHGTITVRRNMTKDGSTLTFETQNGFTPDQTWLTDLFDIFMISPKMFTQLSPKEQAVALGIDLSDFDEKIKEKKEDYRLINRQIKEYGTLEPVEEALYIDVKESIEARKKIIAFNEEQDKKEKAIADANQFVLEIDTDIVDKLDEIKRLQEELAKLNEQKDKATEFAAGLPTSEKKMDLSTVEERIEKASEINIMANEYATYKEKERALQTLISKLDRNKIDQQQLADQRTKHIQAMDLPFDNMEVDEEGQLLLEGKFIKDPYFSTGQLIKIVPILMATRNPEFRYVYIQDFNLLDEEMQKSVVDYLTGEDFQLVIEFVGDKNVDAKCIKLKDNIVVEETSGK